MSVLLLILGLLLFVGLVVVHEFGHFLIARRNGVEVEEFGIGFPPRAWSRKTKSGFLFSLNWLPIGGFVKLKGEHDADTEPGTFGAASTWAKSKIMLAGVAVNLLVAFLLFMVVAWIGMPQIVENQFTVKSDTTIVRNDVLVSSVEPGSPAEKAGLRPRDKLTGYLVAANPLNEIGSDSKPAPLPIKAASDLPELTSSLAGKKIILAYLRDGHARTATLQLRTAQEVAASKKTDKPKGYLGVTPGEYTLQRSTWSAPVVAAGLVKQFTELTFKGLATAVGALSHGDGAKASEQVSGPVGIIVVLKDGSLLGIQFILLIIAIISLTLALMNVLPVPALDGGRLFLMLITRLGGKELSQDMEERIVGASFLLLLVLVVLITVVDVKRFF